MSQPNAFAAVQHFKLRINLGGEGEVPGVLNQQPPIALRASWRSGSRKTVAQLVADGHAFVIADNRSLPFPDNFFDEVITNNVPLDKWTAWGPGVQRSEIYRILKPGGQHIADRVLAYTKP